MDYLSHYVIRRLYGSTQASLIIKASDSWASSVGFDFANSFCFLLFFLFGFSYRFIDINECLCIWVICFTLSTCSDLFVSFNLLFTCVTECFCFLILHLVSGWLFIFFPLIHSLALALFLKFPSCLCYLFFVCICCTIFSLLASCYSEQLMRVAQRLSVKPINTCQVDDFDRMSNLWFMLPAAQPTRDAHPVAGPQRRIAP